MGVVPPINAMNHVLHDFIPHITMPFFDDIPMRGVPFVERDESFQDNGMRKFVFDHMCDVEKVLQRIVDIGLTFSAQKSSFALAEVLIIGFWCGPYGKKPDP